MTTSRTLFSRLALPIFLSQIMPVHSLAKLGRLSFASNALIIMQLNCIIRIKIFLNGATAAILKVFHYTPCAPVKYWCYLLEVFSSAFFILNRALVGALATKLSVVRLKTLVLFVFLGLLQSSIMIQKRAFRMVKCVQVSSWALNLMW